MVTEEYKKMVQQSSMSEFFKKQEEKQLQQEITLNITPVSSDNPPELDHAPQVDKVSTALKNKP